MIGYIWIAGLYLFKPTSGQKNPKTNALHFKLVNTISKEKDTHTHVQAFTYSAFVPILSLLVLNRIQFVSECRSLKATEMFLKYMKKISSRINPLSVK